MIQLIAFGMNSSSLLILFFQVIEKIKLAFIIAQYTLI